MARLGSQAKAGFFPTTEIVRDRQGHGEINHKPIRLYKPPHLGHFVLAEVRQAA